jgi:DEAD/DEAH box helicase
MPLSTAVVFGGVPIELQRQRLARGVDILVATPGRLLDLIDTRSLTPSSVQVLALDEAGRMLDLGFIHALKRIVKLLPQQRQTLLFSATMPRPIAVRAEDYLNDPVKAQEARRQFHRQSRLRPNRVRNGLPAGGRRIRTLGPAVNGTAAGGGLPPPITVSREHLEVKTTPRLSFRHLTAGSRASARALR